MEVVVVVVEVKRDVSTDSIVLPWLILRKDDTDGISCQVMEKHHRKQSRVWADRRRYGETVTMGPSDGTLCETLWSWYHAAFCLSRWASKVCNYFTVSSILAAWRVQDIRRDVHCNQWYDQSDLSIKIRFICNFEDTDNLLASVWWSGWQSTQAVAW